MTQFITKYAAKQLLGKKMDQAKDKKVVGDDDPFFVMIDHPRRKGKKKKVKKQVPDYIPEHDAVVLAKMRQRAYWLDVSLFELAGVRFGWSSVIGIIPAAGDAIDALLALGLVMRCRKVECGLPMPLLITMLINVAIDFVIGLVPIIGDIFDAMFRANTKNLRILEKHLDDVYKPKELKASDKRRSKLGEQIAPPATEYEYFEDDEDATLPRHNQDVDAPRVPQPAKTNGAAPEDAYYAPPTGNDPRRQKSTKSTRR